MGANNEGSPATGIDGSQGNDPFGAYSGAAYTYQLSEPGPWVNLGLPLAGTHGAPLLIGSGSLLPGEPLSLALTNALESTGTYFVLGAASLNLPFYGGTLVPAFEAPLGLFIPLATDGSGALELPGVWPGFIPSGTALHFQHWIVDAGGPFGLAASNAVRATAP